jgi:hypothetical protein
MTCSIRNLIEFSNSREPGGTLGVQEHEGG